MGWPVLHVFVPNMKLGIDSGLILICWMGCIESSVGGIRIIRSRGRKLPLSELWALKVQEYVKCDLYCVCVFIPNIKLGIDSGLILICWVGWSQFSVAGNNQEWWKEIETY